MRLFSLEISRARKAAAVTLSGVDNYGWRSVMNFWPGQTWQNDVEVNPALVTANWAVFSCMTLIQSDIGKVNLDLVSRRVGERIWRPAYSSAFSPVLRKPNPYQTRQQFVEQWINSKLSSGNAYILKQRDSRKVVVAEYVLDPNRVRPLVAPNGEVFYQLGGDDLSRLPNDIPAAPASEIIHDRMNCLFHPLVGLSPIYACGLAATQGLKIQNNSTKFFENMSRPSGVLTGPGEIKPATAARMKEEWEANFAGEKIGRVAVLGDGLKYEAMAQNAVDSQMLEQLKATAEMVCSTFHVPAFKIGAGTIPAGQKVEDLNQIYYADCLHALMDSIQTLQVYGLGLDTPKDGVEYSVRFDLDDLLKMDSATLTNVLKEQTGAGLIMLDEGRERLNLPPMKGGDAAYLQQQNYSVEALAKRDALPDPFGKATPPPAPAADPPPAPPSAKEIAIEVAPLLPKPVERSEIEALITAAVAPLRESLDAARETAQQAKTADDLAHEQVAKFLRTLEADFDVA